jgi:uncharacterized damage-inducible protein DinB
MDQAAPALDPRYPVGRFQPPAAVSAEDRVRFINDIEQLPARLREAIAGLSPAQLDTPYREGGWTARQVIHHLADSHINSFVRFKLALTENAPTIKPYNEAAWAETADARTMPLEPSLSLIDGLHTRWTVLLRSLSESDYQRQFTHPDRGLMKLDVNLALYAWHGRHHTAHITGLRQRMGW